MRLRILACMLVMMLPAVWGAAPPVRAQGDTAEPPVEGGDFQGDEGAEEDIVRTPIRVVQRRALLRRNRVALQFAAGRAISDTMFSHIVGTAGARYHFNEEWSVGAVYDHQWAETSRLFQQVTDQFELFPELAMVRWCAGVNAGWTPVYGKFALFDEAILHFDLNLLAGVGVMFTARTPDLKPAIHLGAGGRLYVTRWLALALDLRNQTYREAFHAGDAFMNHTTLQAGLEVFIPFDFEYQYPR